MLTARVLLAGELRPRRGRIATNLKGCRAVGDRPDGATRPATVHAIKAVGLAILIELTAALLAATAWAVGVLVT